jgi:hypothetical protein
MNAFRKFRMVALVALVAVMIVGFASTSADAGCHRYSSFYGPSYGGYGYNCYTPSYNSCFYPSYNCYSPIYYNGCYNTWPVTYLP